MEGLHTKKTVLCSCGDTWFGVYAARALLRTGAFDKVCAGVSDPHNELSRSLEREGVRLCTWDLNNVESIQKALEGVHYVLLVPAPNMNMVDYTKNLITGIENSKIHHCLMWSCASVHTSGTDIPIGGKPELEKGQKIVELGRQVEEHFLESKIDAKCITRILFPMQYFFFFSDIIQNKGIIPLATGHGKFAPVHVKDVGLASAQILVKGIPQEHRSQIYTFTGPQLVSGHELVELANKSLDGTLTFKDSSLEEMKGIFDKLVNEGEMTDFERDLLLYENYLIREGQMSMKTDDLKRILEREPTNIEVFFDENKSAFRPGLSRFFNRWVMNI